MHPLPHSVSDAGVHQLKCIAWGSTNLSWGIAFQELQSRPCKFQFISICRQA